MSRQQLLATAHSLKEKEWQINAEQEHLNDRWTKVLSAKEGYSTGPSHQRKSYPCRRLLPQLDDELANTSSPTHTPYDIPDRPPRGRDRAAHNTGYRPATTLRWGRDLSEPDD